MKNEFNVKDFKKANIQWVRFVIKNRNTTVKHNYDIIVGPTADAAAQELMESFYKAHKHKEASHKEYTELISKLQVYNFPKQLCIVTQEALNYIEDRYIGYYDLKENNTNGEDQ